LAKIRFGGVFSMDFSTGSGKERRKVQALVNGLSRKPVERPAKIELYQDNLLIPAEIVKRYDQGVIKYFLIKPDETVKAAYVESLWEKELYKWAWGSKELNIET
jgi:hypothetical protein